MNAPVVAVGSTGDAITVPDRVSTVGWWVGGAAPGSPIGATVLVGHVDSAFAGAGALFNLDRVRAGDLIEVTAGTGPRWRYRVTALRTVAKSVGLSSVYFDQASAPRLVLITCGGPFDTNTRSYRDNVVVLAAPQSGK